MSQNVEHLTAKEVWERTAKRTYAFRDCELKVGDAVVVTPVISFPSDMYAEMIDRTELCGQYPFFLHISRALIYLGEEETIRVEKLL